jgi:hypothetical protein
VRSDTTTRCSPRRPRNRRRPAHRALLRATFRCTVPII